MSLPVDLGSDRRCSLVLLRVLGVCGQVVGPLLEGSLDDGGLLPKIGGEHVVRALEGVVRGLEEVTHGLGVALSRGVAIVDAGVPDELLRHGRPDEASSAGSGDQAHTDGAALASDLGGDGVGEAELVTPETATNGDEGELGVDDATTDGRGDFLGALLAEADVAVEVTDDDEGFEAGALPGSGLLLDGHDLHDLILDLGLQEVVDDLRLLDGEGVEEDLLEGLDLPVTHQATKAGHGGPHLRVLVTTTRATGATATAAVTALTTATAATEATAESTALARRSCVCH